MKKKLLFLGHLPPPFYGVTILNSNILSGAINNYFAVDAVPINTSKDIRLIEKMDLKKIFYFISIIGSLIKNLCAKRYGLCYFTLTPTGMGFCKDLLLVFLLKAFRVKTVFHLHGLGISQKKIFFWCFLYKFCFYNSKVIVMSKMIYYDVKDYVAKDNVFVLANGIKETLVVGEYKRLAEERARKADNKSPLRLLFLSNMVKSKGIFDLLEALNILKQKGYNFKCAFAGNWFDIDREEFNSRIKLLNLDDSVDYLGFKEGEEKNALLKKSDLFVYPTLKDTFPLVLLEAMQFGLPVVSTRVGAIPEIIEDGVVGCLVSEHNPYELSGSIAGLMNDASLRIKMGAAARNKFETEYTFSRFEKNLINILTKVSNFN